MKKESETDPCTSLQEFVAYVCFFFDIEPMSFFNWALGDFKALSFCETPRRWNELHSDLFVISDDESPVDSVKKMLKSYIRLRDEGSLAESNNEDCMDKQIRKIEKKEQGVAKDLKGLEKADKKRDKACEKGEKMMKKKN